MEKSGMHFLPDLICKYTVLANLSVPNIETGSQQHRCSDALMMKSEEFIFIIFFNKISE